jgi:hypothetical protein
MRGGQSSGVIQLNDALGHCRHGAEIQDFSAKESPGAGWVIWGHYACAVCRVMALHVASTRPQSVQINGRRFPVILT